MPIYVVKVETRMVANRTTYYKVEAEDDEDAENMDYVCDCIDEFTSDEHLYETVGDCSAKVLPCDSPDWETLPEDWK